MDFLLEFAMFGLKVVVVVVGLVVFFGVLGSAAQRRRDKPQTMQLFVRCINSEVEGFRDALNQSVLGTNEFKKLYKQRKKQRKAEAKAKKKGKDEASPKKRMFVVDFKGDIDASRTENLRQEITAILSQTREDDEVLVRVESAGGTVHGYGLAASQLTRIRNAQVFLTVAVDRVAASGGDLMAVVANQIIAAPFALLGSIGVAAEVPNAHKLLSRFGVDYDVYTAGKHKRPVSFLAENTEEGTQKLKDDLLDVHGLFQEFIGGFRKEVDMQRVSTGETWYGERAKSLNLIDRLMTSDEYLCDAIEETDIYHIRCEYPRKGLRQFQVAIQRALAEVRSWMAGLIR
ncbi:MAG: protease SohB [Pseudomonadales bacterium]|nr:protease SohB [Pseudomonadales bacterium]